MCVKMLSVSEAKNLVLSEIGNECGILDDHTIERKWGWVFFFQSNEFIESGNFRDMLAGNAPYIVNKNTGNLHITGTAYEVKHYINEYEKTL